jgi:ADP-heptose:LPS heptosyltransferase
MKILIVQIGRYGDMILTTPLVSAIRSAYPDANIDIIASRQNYRIIEGNPHIHRVWTYKKGLPFFRLLLKLRSQRYDIWIDPKDHFSRESSLLAYYSNVPIKIGQNTKKNRAFTHPLPQYNSKLHRVETNLAALLPLGISQQFNSRPELFPLIDSELFVQDFLANIENHIVLNISAGDQSRYLSTETWKTICNAISSPIVVNYTPEDATIAFALQKNAANVHIFPSRSIMDTVSLVKRAALVISPDTSVIHIASAFDIPTLGLYPAIEWNYERFRPLSTFNRVLQPEAGKTLRELSSDKILTALEQFSL